MLILFFHAEPEQQIGAALVAWVFHLFCNGEAELTPELVFIFNNLTHFCGSDDGSEADMSEDVTTFLEREKKVRGQCVWVGGG